MKPSLGSVSVYLGLSKPSKEIGIFDHEVYFNDTVNLTEQYESCLEIEAPKMSTLCAYDVHNPHFSPKGTGVVVLTALSDGEAWKNLNPGQYLQAKDMMARSMIDRANRYYPGLRDAIETVDVSTPITNMRYTGNPGGAIYGFAMTPEQNPGFRLDNKGPLSGLWFAGAWTQPGGGYQATINSGKNVARDILAERGDDIETFFAVPSNNQSRNVGALFKGYGLFVRDAKRVGKVISSKYKKVVSSGILDDYAQNPQDIVSSFRADRLPLELEERIRETTDTVTLRFKSQQGTLPPFHAGQYFNLHIETAHFATSRPYSISSAPNKKNHLDITIKRKSGGLVSNFLLDELKVGDVIPSSGPYGEFTYNPHRDTREIVGLAVGSGITPFMSFIDDIDKLSHPPRMLLLYGSRTKEDMIFEKRLMDKAQTLSWLTVVPVLSGASTDWAGEKGRVSAEVLRRYVSEDDAGKKTFYICGPSAFYASMIEALKKMNVESKRIRLESFGPPDNVTEFKQWPSHVSATDKFAVSLKGKDQVLSAVAGESILTSLERAGKGRPAICRTGDCGSCKMKIVSGKTITPTGIQKSEPNLAPTYIHTCVTYPLSDVSLSA